MLSEFEVRNFRGFRSLRIQSLQRINLIAGANNVGKTALLEGIFLHLGVNNPELPLRINIIRGIERYRIQPEELWGWLFHDKNLDVRIELRSRDAEGQDRQLEISLSEPERSRVSGINGESGAGSPQGSLTTEGKPRELLIAYSDSTGQSSQSRVLIEPPGELSVRRSAGVSIPLAIYLSTRARFVQEDAERFSNIARTGHDEALLPILRRLEPRLKKLSVVVSGGVPLIHGDIGLGELVPLPIMGEGMVRLISILLAIANAPRGYVMVDEIENGLHHTVMKEVFQAIGEAARGYQSQVFATTHNWECIRAAHEASSGSDVYDFRLHRLERVNGEIMTIGYDQEALGAAIGSDLEVR